MYRFSPSAYVLIARFVVFEIGEFYRDKCLYKINFVFFTKILDDLFHILDQMSKAGICPKFDPFINTFANHEKLKEG